MSKLLGLILLLVRLSWQQDPVVNFCRRWGHQTAVIDEKLYIDGGQSNYFSLATNPQNVSNSWLLYNDLTNNSALGMPQLHATNFKNSTVPDVTGGILWEDTIEKRFYMYGGEYLNDGLSPSAVNLWSFDAINDYWVSFGAPAVTAGISAVSYAGHASVSEIGQAYALGGWMSNATSPNWSGGPVASSGMIKYTMDSNSWTNQTGPDSIPKAEGVMVYIPASDHGLLIYFGGVTAPYFNSTIVENPMSNIYVYDITSSKWYTQTATGDIPPDRRRFCGGATWAADKSSYNIYIYGGLGFGDNSTGFDDLWILTLPSFTWIKWYQGTNPAGFHHSLTCNVVNNAQMLVIGGTFPVSDQCDTPNVWGTHNVDMGKVSGNMWAIFTPNLTTYHVPPEVISVVGGSSLGGATATAPAAGFQSGDLGVYFTEHASAAARTATRSASATSSPSKKLSTGAIAGIAVGGAVVLIAFLLGCCCLIRRHRQRVQQQQPPVGYPAPDYSVVPQTPHSPYTPGGSQYPGPYQPPMPVQQAYPYQLPAAVPVELQGNNYQMDPTKNAGIQQLPADGAYQNEGWQRSPHGSPQAQHISPSQSVHSPHPTVHSPHPSYFTPADSNTSNTLYSSPGSATSPTPTYSSTTGRAARKPVPTNQTYYSP